MKSKYSIGFLSCCACLIIAMTFAYQFSYQKAKARAEKLKLEEQQTMASKNDCYYLMEVNGYIVVYFSDKKTPYEYTDIHYDELPELLRQEIRNGKYIESTAELYGFLENYST